MVFSLASVCLQMKDALVKLLHRRQELWMRRSASKSSGVVIRSQRLVWDSVLTSLWTSPELPLEMTGANCQERPACEGNSDEVYGTRDGKMTSEMRCWIRCRLRLATCAARTAEEGCGKIEGDCLCIFFPCGFMLETTHQCEPFSGQERLKVS